MTRIMTSDGNNTWKKISKFGWSASLKIMSVYTSHTWGDQVKTLAFVSVVNFRIVSELRGIKFELKTEEITYTRLPCYGVLFTYSFVHNLQNMHKYSITANNAHSFIFRPTFFTVYIHIYFMCGPHLFSKFSHESFGGTCTFCW